MRDPNTRHWAICTNPDCSDWKSAEAMDPYWADCEGASHLLKYRLTDDYNKHFIVVMHRDVVNV